MSSSATRKRAAALGDTMLALGHDARAALASLAAADGDKRSEALKAAARQIRARSDDILAANAADIAAARERGTAGAMIDRLLLDPERVEAMAAGVETVSELADPVGRVLAEWDRPNGLTIQRVAVPLGVIGIIYESRPNVTADAAALCIKSGNAAILRGGSESVLSSRAIHACMQDGLVEAGIDPNAVQLVPTTDREAVGFLLSSMAGLVDVVVPRGGKSLVRRVQEEARVPVIGHLDGICHVYVHADANPDMARDIVLNAKLRRTGICGAAETVLIDAALAAQVIADIVAALADAGCEVRGDERIAAMASPVTAATEDDWSTEYLDAIVSMRVVDGVAAAVDHIRRYGSGHTESIVTDDAVAAREFLESVDSAIVMHNASTQFADGGEFGMGAEIGIATGRVHARGPVGAEQLTSYKYVVRGSGQTRP
ncbi:MAG: glutamate-5-semialdehyde dehydrogenase [Woeseiaceae bacterium]|nr:glutamate-5-semialdehyde dehydrogenase [Woeseiaceae bacterium]